MALTMKPPPVERPRLDLREKVISLDLAGSLLILGMSHGDPAYAL
jgi:hypothetical protein